MTIEEIYRYLSKKRGKLSYAIPKKWVAPWFSGRRKEYNNVIVVDPYEYYSTILEKILKGAREGVDYSKSYSEIYGVKEPSWIKTAHIYAMFVRSSLSYNHKGFGRFEEIDIFGYRESGTFLKAIGLFPYLKMLGVDTIYLLPVSKYSDLFKKGEVGSPYAVKNPKKIDDRYHDPILEDFSVEEEFKAFVEAAHVMGFRVLLDFIPRTAARDSDLILDHPEWFYWIDVEEIRSYAPPEVPGVGFKIPSEDDLEYIYSLESVREHLKKFRKNPKEIDPQRWENFVKRVDKNNFLPELVKEFGVITPPGFSDWINDPQPTWDDVTFLRLFLDHPKASKRFLNNDQPPYVLFDVIKASLFPGERENEVLWEYISSIIPYYQKEFGIDGVRLDMGHALPRRLEKMIMDRAREIDPAFVFIAEELDISRAEHSKKSGYDAIIGNSWWMMPRVPDKAYEFYQVVAPKMKIPYLASSETPDTPRIKAREYGEKLKKLIPFLMAFAPNGILFTNSGQEIGEVQPLNLGLDNTDEGKTVLPPSDEFYAKLGFFDHYAFHWNEPDDEVLSFLRNLSMIRGMYIDLITEGEYKPVWLDWQDGKTANASYWGNGRAVIIVANLDMHPRSVKIHLYNTRGGEIKVERMRIWTEKGWERVEAKNEWTEVFMEEFGFALVELFFREV